MLSPDESYRDQVRPSDLLGLLNQKENKFRSIDMSSKMNQFSGLEPESGSEIELGPLFRLFVRRHACD
jgi:hypothetical protein